MSRERELRWLIDNDYGDKIPFGAVLRVDQVNELSGRGIITRNNEALDLPEEEDRYYVCAKDYHQRLSLYKLQTVREYHHIKLSKIELDQNMEKLSFYVREAIRGGFSDGVKEGEAKMLKKVRNKILDISQIVPEGWIRTFVQDLLKRLVESVEKEVKEGV